LEITMMATLFANRILLFTALYCASLALHAQAPMPIVKEGRTVKISPHVYLIPDEKVGMVPNVGIIVGSRATLVVDPGMGLRSGQAVLREVEKISKNKDLYIVNTHFHPEHTTGDIAFPKGAKLLRSAAQQQDVEEMGLKWVAIFASRSPMLTDVLQGSKFRAPAEIFEKEKRSIWAACG
jgi:glyoxylase-like metal-dependent hydrolase (beta-lactamase superfamily II)